MKVLVTGCCGFIGSHLVDRLLEKGAEVIGIDNESNSQRTEEWKSQFTYLRGDINDTELVAKAFTNKIAVVFHLAAVGSIPRSKIVPYYTTHTNVDGFNQIMEFARMNEVRGFVFASSSSVKDPSNPYAISKLYNEQMAKPFFGKTGTATLGLRFHNVYGPRQRFDISYPALVPKLMQSILHGARVEIDGAGQQARDFTYVDDVVDALMASLGLNIGFGGMVMDIGRGQPRQVLEVVDIVKKLDDRLQIELSPSGGGANSSCAQTIHAEFLLKFKAETSLEEGLEKTYKWYMENFK